MVDETNTDVGQAPNQHTDVSNAPANADPAERTGGVEITRPAGEVNEHTGPTGTSNTNTFPVHTPNPSFVDQGEPKQPDEQHDPSLFDSKPELPESVAERVGC